MKVIVCDSCKKIIDNETNKVYVDVFILNLCDDCKKKISKIQETYYKALDNLALKETEIFNNLIKQLKEEGIKIPKEIDVDG